MTRLDWGRAGSQAGDVVRASAWVMHDMRQLACWVTRIGSMTRTELLEFLNNGENLGVEFKRDNVRPESLAREMAAFINLNSGHILLGVEDGGSVSGLTRDAKDAEEWAMEVTRSHV